MIKYNFKRIFAMFCIALMITIPIAVAADTNLQSNQTSDTVPPYINTEIPTYVSTRTIDIAGKTEPMSRVDLYLNGELKRSSGRDANGAFSFPSVELNPLLVNALILKAEDQAGNKNEKAFSITLDEAVPSITLNNVPSASSSKIFQLKGTVSESSNIKISLNKREVSTVNNATEFSYSLNLNEGENEISVSAKDKAGNSAEETRKIAVDTTPLKLIEINPKKGALFYEGYAVSDIEGKTKPNAKVELFIGEKKSEADHKTTADSSGYFKFEQVNLEPESLHISPGSPIGGGQQVAGVSGQTGAGFETSYNAVPQGTQQEEAELGLVGERKQDVTNLKLYLKMTSATSAESITEEVNYRIGTCFSGAMDWSIQNLNEYQSPNSLSPERLVEGNEIISTVLKLEYVGGANNASVRDISFEKLRCDSPVIAENERYVYACKILPNSPRYRKPNDDKKMWYVRYDLNKLEGVDNFTKDLWNDLTQETTFLLKLKVHYTYLDEQGIQRSDMQQVCMPLTYHLDKSRIDPRDVLPDFLNEETLAIMNKTITKLNNAIILVEKVVKYAAIGCLAGFALKTISIIYRRMSEWGNYLTDKVDPNKDKEEKCPVPTKGVKGYTKGDKSQQDLSNEELEKRCPDAYSAWKSEESAYSAYRWTCDRFLCKGTPAEWTKDKDYDTIRMKLEESSMCNEATGTQGAILKKVQDCKDKCTGYEVCYENQGTYYVYKENTQPENGYYKLSPCGRSGEIITSGDQLYVTLESGNAFLEDVPEASRNCKDVCTNPKQGKTKWANGECITPQKAIDKFTKVSYSAEGKKLEFKDFYEVPIKPKDCKDNEKCYCYSNPKDTGNTEANPGDKWDYRLDKTGQIYYPKFRYYEGRDQSACFGQNHIIFGEDAAYLNPSDIIPAFQCVCTTQIRNRLVAFRNILQGLYGCIQQIKATGKADHGVCKEMFTQYVCKWMYQIIAWFMKGCAPWGGTDKDVGIGDYLQAGAQSLFGGVAESTSDLLSDYDSPALRNYLGVGEEALANKICLGALTGDWGFDLEGFIDAAYATPYHTSAYAWPADREYLTWDPDNFYSTYEYRIAWFMTPGCDISSYSVKLSCINKDVLSSFDGARCEQAVNKQGDETETNTENPGCDCYNLDNEKTYTIFTGRGVSQGQFVNQNIRKSVDSPYRYDNVKIEVYMADPKMAEKCIPTENRVGKKGVFYFPISDKTTYDIAACRFDQLTGKFVCNQGMALWQKRGRGYFGEIKCDGIECKSASEKTYYLGDQISLTPFNAFYTDKRQCVNIQVYNQNRQVLLGERGVDLQLDIDEKKAAGETNSYPKDIPVMLKKVELADFSRTVAGDNYDTRIEPATSGGKRVSVSAAGEIRTGDDFIYFHKKGNNSVEYLVNSRQADGWKDLSPTEQIDINGIQFTFFNPEVPDSADECGLFADSSIQKDKPCKKYKVSIIKKYTTSVPNQDQTWKIHVEMRHAPGEENEGSCYDSTANDVITYQGAKQSFDYYVRASPIERPACIQEGGVCKAGGCTYYKDNSNKEMGCGKGKFCCETSLEKIKENVEAGQ